MDYSPFNPVIWLIFAGFVAVTYLAVKVFHGKYPDYPNGEREKKNNCPSVPGSDNEASLRRIDMGKRRKKV